jgi:putative membrane protein
MIAVIALAVLAIAWILRALGPGGRADMAERSSLDILKDRFARGEIDQSEYEKRRQVLSGS